MVSTARHARFLLRQNPESMQTQGFATASNQHYTKGIMVVADAIKLSSRFRVLHLFVLIVAITCSQFARSQTTELVVDTVHSPGPIDLTRYALGQGGLSDQPMITSRIDQIAQLHPKTMHIFLQEYFDIYPAHNQYHWDTFDKTLEAVRATGATPIVSLVFKPKVLFPKVDDSTVAPTSWSEWENVIFHVVKHVNDRNFGVKLWILTNEGDLGEPGGVPFRFPNVDSYLEYFRHTASAILRADPSAKIGGPAPANWKSDEVDALIAAAGKGEVPLDFLTFHGYNNDPEMFRHMIDTMKAKLSSYPSLTRVQTFIDQWNFSSWATGLTPNVDPYYQPAFVMETTRVFYEAGLEGAAFFHIRDYFVDEKEFTPWMSAKGTANMARWWNEMPQYEGIYDNQDRVKPDYFAFKLLSLIRGQKLPVAGTGDEIHALAARGGHWVNLVIWNYPQESKSTSHDVVVRFPDETEGHVRVVRLNAAAASDNLEQMRYDPVTTLQDRPIQLTLHPYEIYWIEITE